MGGVRQLMVADAAVFRALRLEALRLHPDAYGSVYDDWAEAKLSVFEARLSGGFVAGYFEAEALVGIAAFDREKGGNTRHRGLITAVYVQQAFRGRGVLGRLLTAILAQARSLGVAQVELSVAVDNPAAIAGYRRAGFEVFATAPRALLSRGRYIDEALMLRRLNGPAPVA